MYQCEKCNKKVPALKMYSIQKAPNVLVITLKRFSARFQKINTMMAYPEKLDIAPFLSQEATNQPSFYRLFGLVVHEGHGL
jgi:ubiquitin carboxyl-terminal hydrolase 36/42